MVNSVNVVVLVVNNMNHTELQAPVSICKFTLILFFSLNFRQIEFPLLNSNSFRAKVLYPLWEKSLSRTYQLPFSF